VKRTAHWKRIDWTPELTRSAVGMFRAGHSWESIAIAVGCSAPAVRRKLTREGIARGTGIPGEREVSFRTDFKTWLSLNASASARGKSVGEMMSDVAEVLADGVLLENVLDDGVSL
jgi:hypothetical protein